MTYHSVAFFFGCSKSSKGRRRRKSEILLRGHKFLLLCGTSASLCSAKQKLTGGSWQLRGVKFKALVVPAQQMGTSLFEVTWGKHWSPGRDLWPIQWTILSQSVQHRVFQSSHGGLF